MSKTIYVVCMAFDYEGICSLVGAYENLRNALDKKAECEANIDPRCSSEKYEVRQVQIRD